MNENEPMKIGTVDRFDFYESEPPAPVPQVEALHRRGDLALVRRVREIATMGRIRQGGMKGLQQLFPTLGMAVQPGKKRRKRGGKGRR